METGEIYRSPEANLLEELDNHMLAIIGVLERPADYQWVRAHLPANLSKLFTVNTISNLSNNTGWHFGTAANQYIAERLGSLVEPVEPYGFKLSQGAGEEAYEQLLEKAETDPEFSFVRTLYQYVSQDTQE